MLMGYLLASITSKGKFLVIHSLTPGLLAKYNINISQQVVTHIHLDLYPGPTMIFLGEPIRLQPYKVTQLVANGFQQLFGPKTHRKSWVDGTNPH